MKLKKQWKRIVSIVCVFTMLFSLNTGNSGLFAAVVTSAAQEKDTDTTVDSDAVAAVVDAFKEKENNAISRVDNTGDLSMLSLEENYQGVDDTQELETYSLNSSVSMPQEYDLRSLGVVTPVKLQNPFGTCWGFASIAAAETSILSELGTTYEETGLDLSEHQLSWFAATHLPEDGSSQGGEGRHYISGNPFNTGGFMWYATSVFSSGIGPISESDCPYSGANKNIQYDSNGTPMNYSSDDDWSLDESLRFYQSYELEESSILPSTRKINIVSGEYEGYDETGTNAIKSELMDGKAVSVLFNADTSQPGQEAQAKYINLDTWAHYTYNDTSINHAVTIVGWDDNYSKDNFLDHSKDIGGDGQAHLPEGNGAWIVKNSWGADTETFPNKYTWGIKDENGVSTGYFYISYYDRSLQAAETFDFCTENDDKNELGYIIDQHDYMVSEGAKSILFSDETKMANIFIAEQNQSLRSVATQTASMNTNVTYEIYLLKDDCTDPTDGYLVDKFDTSYQYAGYHRENLDKSIFLREGQKYSIVVKQSINMNSSAMYEIHCATSVNKNACEKYDTLTYYSVGIVNKGESYFTNGETWIDWSEVTSVLDKGLLDYDNFAIKAYSEFSEKQGLVHDQDGWHYYKDGVIDYTYEGIAANEYGEWYVRNGAPDISYTGAYYNDEAQAWYYFRNGLYIEDYTGPVLINESWRYLKFGVIIEDYTGAAINDSKEVMYFTNGDIDKNYSGIGMCVDDGMKLFVFDNGTVDMSFEGFKYCDCSTISQAIGVTLQPGEKLYRWIYQKNGQMDIYYNGTSKIEDEWWNVEIGIANSKYTGMLFDEDIWWYVEDGKVSDTYTGMAENSYGWWYFKDGRIDWTYTGMAENSYGWWYFKDGRIDWTYTGMAENNYGWWYFKDGRIDWTYTGMAENSYGWWYFKDGRIDWTYTGWAENSYGRWYFKDGRIDFNHSDIA